MRSASRVIGQGARKLGRWCIFRRADFVVFVGGAGVSYGTWLIYEPAGYIVAGLSAVLWGIADAAAQRKPDA